MTLSYSTHINGEPTYFVEKILASIDNVPLTREIANAILNYPFNEDAYTLCTPKIHSLRRDPADRWCAGKLIHSVINSRTPQRLQFAPILECVSTQRVIIAPGVKNIVFVDGRSLGPQDISELALNDGFDGVKEFFEYFKEGFVGKIIHWTDYKY